MAQGMTIGDLAKAAGVNVETVRYYQRRGLIHEPRKPPRGQRRYSESMVDELAFVRRGQQLGFTLADIKDLQSMAATSSWRDVRKIARMRYSRLALNAKQLARTSARLKALLEKSRRYRGAGPDPIIAALQGRKAAT